MFKKEITYHNPLDDSHVTETLYFNLTAPEVAELGLELEDGFETQIKHMVETDDRRKMFAMFKLLMAHSYGRRTTDSKAFVKKKEWLDELFSGFAYEELFVWIFSDANNAAHFFNKIMPSKELLERLNQAGGNETVSDTPKKSPREMSREELEAAFLAKMQDKTPANEVTAS
jgi:hypothetical protein